MFHLSSHLLTQLIISTLQYTYLLTNQLESQRLYFEEKMGEVENTVLAKVHFGLE